VLLTLALRHLVRHWRMNLVVLAGLILGAALLAGLPMFAAVVAGRSLSQSLADAYAPARNLGIRGEQLADTHEDEIHAALGDLARDRVEIREVTVDAQRAIFRPGEKQRINEILYLRLWSFDCGPLGAFAGSTPGCSNVDLLAGRLPEGREPSTSQVPPVLGAAIGLQAAEYMGLGLGDELAFEDDTYRVRIVGIVTPVDPNADMWWGDPALLPFNVEREETFTVDNLYLSLFLPRETMIAHLPAHDMYWRILLDQSAITTDNATMVRDQLVNLEARLGTDSVKLDTGLVELIDTYRSQLSLARVSLLLLTAQSLLAVLYTLGTISTFLLEQSQFELTSLAGRGFSSWQMTRIFGLEAFLLAFGIALPLGPLLVHLGFKTWSRLTSHAVTRAIRAEHLPPEHVPPESWTLALIAVACGWLALVIPLYLTTRSRRGGAPYPPGALYPPSPTPPYAQTPYELGSVPTRGRQQASLQRLSLDLFLLALGGLAYWQLLESGSAVQKVEGTTTMATADPILLLGPSLLLLAIGLVFLRIFPFLLRLAAWAIRAARTLILPLGLTHLARNPARSNRVVLLISLAAGLVFFATAFEDSIAQRQQDMAHYSVGADVRVVLPQDADKAQTDSARIANMPGVLAVSPVYRAPARWGAPVSREVNFESVNLLAVNPVTLAQIAYYPPDIAFHKMASVLSDLAMTPSGVLPVLLSDDAPPRNAGVGDRVQYQIGPQTCEFKVRGIIGHFPTLTKPFAITNLPALEQQLNLGGMQFSSLGRHELWLDVDPARHAMVMDALQSQVFQETTSFQVGYIAGDAQAQLCSLRSNLIAQMTTAAFNLNAATLVVLSSASFVLVQIFTARRRRVEFGVLRAMGLSTRQLLTLLAIEGTIMLLVGLLSGTGIGYGLATVMRPFLSELVRPLALAASLEGSALDQGTVFVIIHWPAIARLYAILAGFYFLALLLALAGLMRSKIHHTLRIGDE
jgi:putative ABC transport system permease protein